MPPVTNPWVLSRTNKVDAQINLFCFHHAGGSGADFKRWIDRKLLPPTIELFAIDLPGRNQHAKEPCHTNIYELAKATCTALKDLFDEKPYVLFGHSLGGALVYEVALERRRRGESLPCHLIISSRCAPHHPIPPGSVILHEVEDDDDFIEEMVIMYKNPAVLDIVEVPQFRATAIKLMRGDIEVFETYVPRKFPLETLPVTISAYMARDDFTNPLPMIKGWSQYTTAGFSFKQFEGGHFFWQKDPKPLIAQIVLEVELKSMLKAPPREE